MAVSHPVIASWRSGLPLARVLMASLLTLSLAACNGPSQGDDIDNGIPTNVDSGGSVDPDPVVESVDYLTAFRFLKQASFGPTEDSIQQVMDSGISGWLDEQMSMPSAYDSDSDEHLSHLQRLIEVAQALEPGADWFPAGPDGTVFFNGQASNRADEYQMSVWFENALDGPDQLRQRVAYALSQILVVSAGDSQLRGNAESLAHYYDILARNAFGNFRTLIGEVARSPAMGIYLSHQGNEKANVASNTLPDENFARELMQLFTIGLYELGLDGRPRRDGAGELIPTYTQEDIEEMARVMTGWDLRHNSRYGRTNGSYVDFMEFDSTHHDSGDKIVMGQSIPGDDTGADLDAALDILFEHASTGPFIGKQLIQRLVTSNPSPAYVARVAGVFNDNGAGVRGDLGAVVRAILMDPEARSASVASSDWFGKAEEHLLVYTTLYRAFDAQPIDGWRLHMETARARVDGIYQFDIHGLLGQGPLRAHHVFNFYDPDYVPQDSFYRDADPQRVLPEMQLRSANNIADMFKATQLSDSYIIERNNVLYTYDSIDEYVAARNVKKDHGFGNWSSSKALALLDYTPALQAFELAMEGDTNGDYSLINSTDVDEAGDTPKVRGLRALLDFLEVRLLGATALDDGFREQLIAHLDTDSTFNSGSSATVKEAIRVTSGAVQYVMMSATNMAQQ